MKTWLKNIPSLKLISLVGFFIFAFALISADSAQALSGDYNKATNGILANTDWNNLPNDFLPLSGGWLSGNLAIGTSSTSTYALNVNGTINATTFIGSLTGSVSAANVSNGAFGSNVGGGLYSFPSNVGIGTTNPGYALEVNGVIYTSGSNYVSGNSIIGRSSVQSPLFFNTTDANTIITTRTATKDIVLNLNQGAGTEIMRLTSSGNVGVGVTNPSYKLQVSQSTDTSLYVERTGANASAGIVKAGDGLVTIGANTFDPLQLVVNANPVMYLTTGANVGIGTTSPAYKLDVSGGQINSSGGLCIAGDCKTAWSQVSGISYWTLNGSTLYASNTAWNIGIGTTSPTYKLSIGTDGSFNKNQGLFFDNSVGIYRIASTQLGIGNGTGDVIIEAGGVLRTANNYRLTASNAAAAPTYTFNTDVDTGIFNPAANSIAISASGTEAMRIIAGGNVGIGTTNPLANLEILASSSARVNLKGLDSGKNAGIYLGMSSREWKMEQLAYNTYGNNLYDFEIKYVGTQYGGNLLFNPAGNVGIGTTNPTSARLVVTGDSTYNIDAGSMKIANVAPGSTSTDAVNRNQLDSAIAGISYWDVNGSNIYASNTSWNVGIGTTSPAYKLDVSGGQINSSGGLCIAGDCKTAWSQVSGTSYWGLNGSNLYASSTAYNVGIGTTNPNHKLEVNVTSVNDNNFLSLINNAGWTSGKYNNVVWRDSTNITGALGLVYNSGSATVDFTVNSLYNGAYKTTAYVPFIIKGSGNVGIGTTTPNSPLHVVGAAGSFGQLNIDSTSTANQSNFAISKGGLRYWAIYTPGENSDFRFYADPARSGGVGDIMTLANTGKVAIGTTTMTSAQLSVNYVGGSGASIDAGNSRVQNLSTATDPKDAISYGQATSTMWGILASPMIANFDLNNHDIINVNKLTVNTIDPLYNIRGTKYSTYAASIAGGVKEEYVGNLRIDTYHAGFGYEKVLDFSKIEAGDDLWVWRNVVDFGPDNVQVFITPFGSFAQTYYLVKDNKIVFRSDKPVSVSYRLIGKRFDWKSWPTKALNQTERAGLVID
ncbi:MAG: hypothetical protein WC441_00775 [Patescibacteria group bacterium]